MKRTQNRKSRKPKHRSWEVIVGSLLLIVEGLGLLFVIGSPSLRAFRSSPWFDYLLVSALTLPAGWYIWICKRKEPLIDRIIASIPLLYLWSSFIPMAGRIRLLLWTVVLLGMIGCCLYLYYLNQRVRSCKLMKFAGVEALLMGVGYMISVSIYSLEDGLFCLQTLLPAIVAAILVAVITVMLIASGWLILMDDRLSERILCVSIASVLTLFLTVTTVLHLNYALEFDEPTIFAACVTEKKSTHSPRGGSTYYLIFDVNDTKVKLIVSKSEYQEVEIGDDYTLAHFEGAFGIPFYLAGE